MLYVIPVYVPKVVSNYESFSRALERFVAKRLGYKNTFEIHNDKNEVQLVVYNNDINRLCTTSLEYTDPNAMMMAYDFDPELNTYFIAVKADKNFNPKGKFYPRILAGGGPIYSDKDVCKVKQIVALDYIVRGDY